MHRYPRWPIHLALCLACFVMLVPFYWVFKTSITGENIFAYPPSLLPQNPQPFFYVDAWYAIPFPWFFLNSVIVAATVIVANLLFNAAAGYALTKSFGRRAKSVPAAQGCVHNFLLQRRVLATGCSGSRLECRGSLCLKESCESLAIPQAHASSRTPRVAARYPAFRGSH